MRILSSADIDKVARPKQWTDTMELALKTASADKEYFTPQRMHMDIAGNTLLLMPSTGPDVFTTKLVTVFPENKNNDKAVIQGIVLINDGKSGETMALLNGGKLTALRTAAIATVGVRHLCQNTKSMGVVGAGIQGSHIAWLASVELNINHICVFDLSEKVLNAFIEFLAFHRPELEVEVCESVRQLIQKSELIITATTSQQPVIPDDKILLKGKTFIGVGSYKPDMREFPDSLFQLINNIWIDAEHGKKESGDLIYPVKNHLIQNSQIKNISELILNNKENITGETKLYKTVGLAIFDLFAARMVYEKACEMNIGVEVNI